MRFAGMLAGLTISLFVIPQAEAFQTGGASGGEVSVSGRLELSHELRPFPRPSIIVNAVPPVLPGKHVASSQAKPMVRVACSAKRSQESAPPCRELEKSPQPRPAS